MSKQEYIRLYAFHKAKSYSPWKPISEVKGKRLVKNRAAGVGQILKSSKISQMWLGN